MLNLARLLSDKSSTHDCYPTDKPSVSAVLFGCHGINLLENLVSRELLRILENFHFSISISKHFDFTFHFSKKSESILISLCTSRKRVKAFFFHFALLEKEWKLFIFTFHFSNFKNPLSLVPVMQKTKEHLYFTFKLLSFWAPRNIEAAILPKLERNSVWGCRPPSAFIRLSSSRAAQCGRQGLALHVLLHVVREFSLQTVL